MTDPEISLFDLPTPMAPPTAPSAMHLSTAAAASPLDDATVLDLLRQQGYTEGLIQALRLNKLAYAQSIWVVDNSGSMQTRDGHRIVPGSTPADALKFVECSRWTEMQQTVDYHAQMAALLHMPTTFRLLNDPGRVCGPQIFGIGVDGGTSTSTNTSSAQLDEELSIAVGTMQNAQPGGVTPLTQHIIAIRQQMESMKNELQHHGTKVAIVLATDGLPSDSQGYSNDAVKRDFVSALRSLEGLPVWIVVRLCTDDADVVQYWNDLDSQLELSLEVLDDFVSEAQEVHTMNPWLTYCLPLHRMREMGFHHALLDLLDERKLSRDEVRDFLYILLGRFDAPDPEVNWKGFGAVVDRLVSSRGKVYNPITKKMTPLIDMKQLHKQYAHGTGWFGR